MSRLPSVIGLDVYMSGGKRVGRATTDTSGDTFSFLGDDGDVMELRYADGAYRDDFNVMYITMRAGDGRTNWTREYLDEDNVGHVETGYFITRFP